MFIISLEEADRLTEGLILAMLLSLLLLVVGYKLRNLPVVFISSLGWLISGLEVYQQTAELLPLALLLMLAFCQFFLIKEAE